MQTPKEALVRQEHEQAEDLYLQKNIFPYLGYFTSPLSGKIRFFSEREEHAYEKLYKFRESVKEWSISVSTFDKRLQLLQKSSTAPFFPVSNVEHLVSIELHHLSFIVITMDCDNQDHLHSIIIDMEIPHAKFSIFGLLDTIQNMPYESIRSDLQSMQWKEDDGSELPQHCTGDLRDFKSR
jgi:hypothetical protein